jgi:peptidoglycan/xylan/chitin deacetylase (PgdA/CDA1 family)
MTFDDGPQPPHTDRILDILAAERVKATFFIIGYRTKKFPALVRRIYDEGHTIGTHTQNHPHLPQLPFAEAKKEIEDGIATAAAALGKRRALAPFVRSPYLESVDSVEDYLSSRGIMSWNMGIQAEDWTNISADDVVARALMNLERVGKGVLILHDIQPRTVLALPALLREMRHRGYRVAHVMPISAQIPKS